MVVRLCECEAAAGSGQQAPLAGRLVGALAWVGTATSCWGGKTPRTKLPNYTTSPLRPGQPSRTNGTAVLEFKVVNVANELGEGNWQYVVRK